MNPRTALILAGVALVIGVVGLIIGISAKNGNKSDQDIADATKAQLEQQLGTTASQVKGQVQAQANQQAEASKSVNVQLSDLRESVNRVDDSVKSLLGTTSTQANDIKTLQNDVKTLQDDVSKLDTKVANLEAK
ncbi:MAG TPA: hypothetical protein VH501_09265 [Solirubrobacterales bacterium]|jgi:chromosome segregation ATPase